MRDRIFSAVRLVLIMAIFAFLFGCSSAFFNEGNSGTLVNKSVQGKIGAKTTINSGDYSTALGLAINFFDANKCGPNVASGNVFSWRGACHTSDGVAGGFHDAGDGMKFGLPASFSFAVLGLALSEYPNSFTSTQKTKQLAQMKWFSDYFLACYSSSAHTFVYDIGDAGTDHSYWGPPENQTGYRPTWTNTSSQGYADIGMYTVAGLAYMSQAYASIDATYAANCLSVAKTLYADCKANYKYYIPSGQTSYYGFNTDNNGGSVWNTVELDDKSGWAAIALYGADTANQTSYYNDIKTYVTTGTTRGGSAKNQDGFVGLSWNDLYPSDDILAYQIATARSDSTTASYLASAVNYNIQYWQSSSVPKSSGGEAVITSWGALRYAAEFAWEALTWIQIRGTDENNAEALAKKQITYALGDNPNNESYLIGFGSTYPSQPHHEAANPNKGSALHLLSGGLVGGPISANDSYVDDWSQYQYSEVALDYNASFIAALAIAVTRYGGGGGSSSSSSAQASSSASFSSGSYYKIINRNSGKLLDVSGGATNDGASVIQWTDNGGYNNQQWQIVSIGNGYCKVINRNSGKLLDVTGGSTSSGASVIQWTDNGGNNQQWQIVDLGGGYYKFVNHNSGLVMDVTGASASDGASIIQWTDNGGNNQQWQVTVASSSSSSSSSSTPSNYVQNPGFETGSLSPWYAWNNATVVNYEQYYGSYAVKCQANSSVEQVVTGLNPNTTYTLSGYIKSSDGGSWEYLGVKNYGGSDTYQGTVGTTYVYKSFTFTTGSTNTTATVYIYQGTGTGYGYGDGITLQ